MVDKKKDKIDNNKKEKELKPKPKAKKIFKKKVKKNIPNAIAHVSATFNNTVINITDLNGNTLAWSSSGVKGFKGSRKSTPYAAQIAADEVATKALEYGMKILI